jgi:hypothetical protein
MTHRATVSQSVQVGVESVAGTAVACNKLLTAFTWTFGAKPTTKQFTGTGRKYPSASEMLTDMSTGKVAGQGDFQELSYIFSSIFKKITPALHSPSSTAYDWKFIPPISGAATPQTFTLQNGDAATTAEQYAYAMFSAFGYSFTRTQEVQITGDWFARAQNPGQSLTSSPSEVALVPMTGAQANVYLDSTSGGIGTTLLANPMSFSYAGSNFFGQFWPINRANASFLSHIDLMPKNEVKMKLEADTTGIAIKGNYLALGARAYIHVDILGGLADAGNSINYEMQHDMACFVSDVSEMGDEQGAYGVEYTLQIAEDTAWSEGSAAGTSHVLTLTNLLSSL